MRRGVACLDGCLELRTCLRPGALHLAEGMLRQGRPQRVSNCETTISTLLPCCHSFLPGDRVPVAFGELPAPQQQPQVQA